MKKAVDWRRNCITRTSYCYNRFLYFLHIILLTIFSVEVENVNIYSFFVTSIWDTIRIFQLTWADILHPGAPPTKKTTMMIICTLYHIKVYACLYRSFKVSFIHIITICLICLKRVKDNSTIIFYNKNHSFIIGK